MNIIKSSFMSGAYDNEPLHLLAQFRAAGLTADEAERRRTRTLTRILRETVNDDGTDHLGPGIDGPSPWTHTDLGRRILDELHAFTARYERYVARGKRHVAWRYLEDAADLVLVCGWLHEDENANRLTWQRIAVGRVRHLVAAGVDHFGLVRRFVEGANADELDHYADDLVEQLVQGRAEIDPITADLRRAAIGIPPEDPDAFARLLADYGGYLLVAIAGALTTGDLRHLATLACRAAGLGRLIQRAGFNHDGW